MKYSQKGIRYWVIALLIMTCSCNRTSQSTYFETRESKVDGSYFINLFSPLLSSNIIMDIELEDSNDHLYAFGLNSEQQIVPNAYTLDLSDKDYYTNMFIGADDGIPYYYNVDKKTKEPSNILMSFTPFEPTKAYVDIYEYDWVGATGKLIYKILIDTDKSGDDRFSILLDYSKKQEFNAVSISQTRLSNLKSDTFDEDNFVVQFEKNIDDALSFFSDVTKVDPRLNALRELGDWLGRKRDFIYEKRIMPLIDGASYLIGKANEVRSNAKNSLKELIANGINNLKTFPGRFVANDNIDAEETIEYIEEEVYQKIIKEVIEKDIDRPDNCNAITQSGGFGTTVTTHFVGVKAGTVNIEYEMYSIPDRMSVVYNGVQVATTGGNVSDTGILSFYFDGEAPYEYKVTVIGDDQSTAWNYTARCPE